MIVKFRETDEDGDKYTDIEISTQDIQIAKKSVAAFLEKLKSKTEALKQPQLYYVSVLAMRIMSEQVLNEVGAVRLEEIFRERKC